MLKAELQDFFYKKNEGKRILEQYEKFYTNATKVTTTFTNSEGRTNLSSDKVGTNAVLMADIRQEYLDLFIEIEEQKVKLYQKLLSLPQPYGKILWLKLVEDWKFESIAHEIKRTPRHTKRLYKRALNLYYK